MCWFDFDSIARIGGTDGYARVVQEYAAAHIPLGKGEMPTLAVTTEGLGPDAVLVTLEGELAFGQAFTLDEALRKSEDRDAPALCSTSARSRSSLPRE